MHSLPLPYSTPLERKAINKLQNVFLIVGVPMGCIAALCSSWILRKQYDGETTSDTSDTQSSGRTLVHVALIAVMMLCMWGILSKSTYLSHQPSSSWLPQLLRFILLVDYTTGLLIGSMTAWMLCYATQKDVATTSPLMVTLSGLLFLFLCIPFQRYAAWDFLVEEQNRLLDAATNTGSIIQADKDDNKTRPMLVAKVV